MSDVMSGKLPTGAAEARLCLEQIGASAGLGGDSAHTYSQSATQLREDLLESYDLAVPPFSVRGGILRH